MSEILSSLLLKVDQLDRQLAAAKVELNSSLDLLEEFVKTVRFDQLHTVKPSGEFWALVPKANEVRPLGVVPTAPSINTLYQNVRSLTKSLDSAKEDLRIHRGSQS